ncbi:L-threonylcarbamoyladenylate synthase [Rubrobacter aplysinae]|uniref:L-threonylcarbamoyladenylate synthase n=1 Tax=Rubrobacter aplysinae TaxID=909625 RepID=UPI00069EE586|nr:L-threonylcarbamoyladenylate synthase [Rubrobacter aplysinae]
MKVADTTRAGEELRGGGVALVPTDTVVGLVAGESGLARLAEIKNRDPAKPVAALCASATEAFSLAADVPPLARELARRFWPGPLTLVLDAPDPRNGGTIGVRVPDHAVVRELLAAYGGPLYATSANLAGQPAPGTLAEVSSEVSRSVDLVVEGAAGGGEASAVVDLSGGGKARLLRRTPWLSEETLSRMAREQE